MRYGPLTLVVLVLTACPSNCPPGGTTCATATGGGSGGATGGGGGATGGGTETVDAGPPITLAAFCAAYTARTCEQRYACGYYDSPTSPECLVALSIDEVCTAVMAGNVAFDGVEARRCLEEVEARPASCFSNYPAFEGCARLGDGRYATSLAGPKVFRLQPSACGGATCDAGVCDRDCTSPACRGYQSVGQSCGEQQRPVARCDPATGWCGNVDGGALTTCFAFGAPGTSCYNGGAASCRPGTSCVYGPGFTTATCEAPLSNGAMCRQGSECASGACRAGVCSAADAGSGCSAPNGCGGFADPVACIGLVLTGDGGLMTPGSCGPRPRLGQPCSYSWFAGTDSCVAGTACLDGVCTTLEPYLQPLGGECPIPAYGRVEAPYYGFATCARGLNCQRSATANAPKTGRCATPLAAGAACNGYGCGPGLNCDLVDAGLRCVASARSGDDCTRVGCRADLRCQQDLDGGAQCKPFVGPDGGCDAGLSCVSGYLCDATSRCSRPGTFGMPCSADYECSGACQAGSCVDVCAP